MSYKNIWELRGNNLGITWEKLLVFLIQNVKVSNQKTNKTIPNVKFSKKNQKKNKFILLNQKTILYLYQ